MTSTFSLPLSYCRAASLHCRPSHPVLPSHMLLSCTTVPTLRCPFAPPATVQMGQTVQSVKCVGKKIYILCFVCSIDVKLLVAISSLSCPPHLPCVVVVPFVLTATPSSSSSRRRCRALAALFSLSHPSLSHRRWRVVVTVVATSSSVRHCRCRVLLASTPSLSSSSVSAPCPFGSPSSCSHRKGVWVTSAMSNEPLGSSTGGREHVEAVSGSQGSRRGFGW